MLSKIRKCIAETNTQVAELKECTSELKNFIAEQIISIASDYFCIRMNKKQHNFEKTPAMAKQKKKPKKPIVKRKYNLSDAELVALAGELRIALNRDAADLASLGVTPAVVTAYANQCEDFSNFKQDIAGASALKGAVAERNAKARALRNYLRATAAILRNDEDIPEYRAVVDEARKLSALKPDELCSVAKIVAYHISTILPLPPANPIDAAYLANLTARITDFKASINKVHERITERQFATFERITRGNALYANMMRLADLGKTRWFASDYVKYNDYALLHARPTKGQKK